MIRRLQGVGDGSTRTWTTLGTSAVHEEQALDLRLLPRDGYLLLNDVEGLLEEPRNNVQQVEAGSRREPTSPPAFVLLLFLDEGFKTDLASILSWLSHTG